MKHFSQPLVNSDALLGALQAAHAAGVAFAAGDEPAASHSPMQPAAAPQHPEPLSKTVATQSDYRESEAQTLPWSSGYVLTQDAARAAKQAALSAAHHCEGPELLTLAGLTFGEGLPPGG